MVKKIQKTEAELELERKREQEKMTRDFNESFAELENKFRLDKDFIKASLEAAIASAIKNEDPSRLRAVKMNIDPKNGEISFISYNKVVEGEPNYNLGEISLEEAQEIDPNAKIGDIVNQEPYDYSKISKVGVGCVKQVFQQRISDAKKVKAHSDMAQKEGELVQAIVRRIDQNSINVEIVGTDQVEGILTKRDQVENETLKVNDRIKVYVKSVRTNDRGQNIVYVSRADAGYVKKLFEIEVPEIKSNLVKIKNIVREGGYRTKMAVYSDDVNVDCTGACIGPKSVRVNAVVSDLKGEKVDIIAYTDKADEYIKRALSPAQVIMVQINEATKEAKVVVPDDKLSLAIGKRGQNARLAAKLTGYKIDVKPLSEVIEASEE